jgi:hypothetical protein
MKTFKADRPCPKCGYPSCYDGGTKEYATAAYQRSLMTGTEFIGRECKRCNFRWREAPLDAEHTVTTTGDVEPQPEPKQWEKSLLSWAKECYNEAPECDAKRELGDMLESLGVKL